MKRIISDLIAKIIGSLLPKRFLLDKKYFRYWEEKGLHITSPSFDSPIPDTRELNDDLFNKTIYIFGLSINEKEQIAQ